MGLRPAEAPVGADQLLERGDLVGRLLEQADRDDVAAVRHAVDTAQAIDGVLAELGDGIDSLHPVPVEVVDPIGPQDHRATRLGADHEQPDALGAARGSRPSGGSAPRWSRATPGRTGGEVDECEVARGAHDQLGWFGVGALFGRSLGLRGDIDVPSAV